MEPGPLPLALVTGGATGIGAQCCIQLAASGFRVAVHHHSSHRQALALCERLPGAFAVGADLADPAAIARLHDVLHEHGTLAALVNNAGVVQDAPLFTARMEDLDFALAINLKAAWMLIKRFSRQMIRARSGRIVNISSVMGSIANPGQAAYGISKAALDSLTRTAALELAPYNVLVNSVAPGMVRTRMTESLPAAERQAMLDRVPLGRIGEPEEVARLVRFLVVEGSYCTGTVFHMNGGLYGG